MFTDVAHRPPLHHFSLPQRSLQPADFNHHPPSQYPTDAAQIGHHNIVRHGGLRQRSQRPGQYAQPLQLPSTPPTQASSRESFTGNTNASEHMLRRKTPNGTLAAGYDGRPIEWPSRPHAMKHYLMPVSNTWGETVYQSVPTGTLEEYSPARNDLSFSARAEEQRHQVRRDNIARSQPVYMTADNFEENTVAPHIRRPDTLPATGLDSVLHQGSLSHHYSYFAGGQQVPTVLQPMWPPCLGLMSLNDSGPYGPYWPDGAFVPYRPAPLRDPRYQCQTQGGQMDGAVQLQLAHNNRGNWSQAGSDIDRIDLAKQPSDFAHRPRSSANHPNPELLFPRGRESPPPSREAYPLQQHEAKRLAYRRKPLPPTPQGLHSDSSWTPSQRPLNTSSASVHQTDLQELNSQASNAQFKEKVHLWAHRIYLSLLASAHQSRRIASQTQRDVDENAQPNIYPKAPRQPSLTPSALTWRALLSQNNSTRPVGLSHSSNDDFSPHFNYQPHLSGTYSSEDFTGKTQTFPLQDERFRQSWQLSGEFNPSAHPPPGRNQHDHPRSTVPTIAHEHENSPATAAATAIKLLERLCQESGWQWTDGLLLGGCLAYGLGDYHEALKWYSKVLYCDPK